MYSNERLQVSGHFRLHWEGEGELLKHSCSHWLHHRLTASSGGCKSNFPSNPLSKEKKINSRQTFNAKSGIFLGSCVDWQSLARGVYSSALFLISMKKGQGMHEQKKLTNRQCSYLNYLVITSEGDREYEVLLC